MRLKSKDKQIPNMPGYDKYHCQSVVQIFLMCTCVCLLSPFAFLGMLLLVQANNAYKSNDDKLYLRKAKQAKRMIKIGWLVYGVYCACALCLAFVGRIAG